MPYRPIQTDCGRVLTADSSHRPRPTNGCNVYACVRACACLWASVCVSECVSERECVQCLCSIDVCVCRVGVCACKGRGRAGDRRDEREFLVVVTQCLLLLTGTHHSLTSNYSYLIISRGVGVG